jgi:hypothetical protein
VNHINKNKLKRKKMINSKVYRLKQDVEVGKDMPLKKGQELEVVMDVVYVNGHMVPPNLQKLFLDFIIKNPTLFDDDTREW